MCLSEETGIKQFTQDLIFHNKEAVDTRQKPSERQNLAGEAVKLETEVQLIFGCYTLT